MSPSDAAVAGRPAVPNAAMAVEAFSESVTMLFAPSVEWRRRFPFSHGVFVPFTARIASAGNAPPASSNPLHLVLSS